MTLQYCVTFFCMTKWTSYMYTYIPSVLSPLPQPPFHSSRSYKVLLVVNSLSPDPTDCSLPDSSVHGIFQARILQWVAISFSRGSSWPRDRTQVSCTAGRHFNLWATREVLLGISKRTRVTHQTVLTYMLISLLIYLLTLFPYYVTEQPVLT